MDRQTSELLVTGMYETLLKRKPDSEMRWHIDKIVHHGFAGVAMVLSDMLGSEEYQRRKLDGLSTPDSGTSKHFSKVISLGTHCYTSFLLKYAGLKRESFPFDWIFSSQKMVLHCLSSDFQEFLDAAHFDRVRAEERVHGPNVNKFHNRYYLQNFQVKYVFNHHDMDDEENVAYFRRSIERFRHLCRSEERTLMVQCAPEKPDNMRVFYKTSEILKTIAPKSALLLIVVAAEDSSRIIPEVDLIAHEDGDKAYMLKPTSAWQGFDFKARIDDLSVLRIIEQQGIDHARAYSPWRTL